MKKILVLGAFGMAGHTISLYLLSKKYEVHTLTRKPFNIGVNIILDVFNREELTSIILNNQYDVIINCIGILNEDANNNISKAIYLNSFLPHFLADITKNTKTKIIQMSTDCVFSGKKGNYKEDDHKDGDSIYDKTKALGEVINDKDLTFRNSIIGPDINYEGIGLFNWFMKQEDSVYGFTNVIWSGVTTLTLAKAMEKAIENNLTGLYNLTNNIPISKFDLLVLFNKYFKKDAIKVTPKTVEKIDKSLISTRNDFMFKVPTYSVMLEEMFDWITKYKEFYPHYKL